MAEKSNVQIIRSANGEPEFAVVPWAEYEAMKGGLSEDDYLIALGHAARSDERFPADVAARLMDDEVPLKVFREWRGLSQGALGQAADIAPHYISQIERGERSLGVQAAKKLARVLKVSVASLLDLEDA